MKFWILLLLFTFGFLISCTEEVPFTYVMKGFTESSIDSCKTIGCPKISLNFANMQGGSEVTEKMNSTIKDYVISALNIGDEREPAAKTVPEAVQNFIKVYRMDSADFPDMSAEYFAEITVLPSSITVNLISLSISEYLYTGGAHGYQNTRFINFNPKNGVELSTEELFEDVDGFITFAEKKFRKAHSISENESINATGFLFEDDVFYLPETIGFLDNDLVLIYNQYEISSYPDGPVKLEIPLSEANEYLNDK